MNKDRIDYIVKEVEKQYPRLGAETEATVIDQDLNVVHSIDGKLPTNAVMDYLRRTFADRAEEVLEFITPDVTALTVEGNPPPLSHPRSTAAAQRLMSIIIDAAVERLGRNEGRTLHTLHGAAWRPSNVQISDISVDVPFDKRIYYEYQAGRNRDKVADAMGDHYNLSLPWRSEHLPERDYSNAMIRMAGKDRLVGSPFYHALGTSSPFYYASDAHAVNRHTSVLTPYESARLYLVWRGRTDMDVSRLWENIEGYEKTMRGWAADGTLASSRAIWLPVRAQSVNGNGVKFKDFVDSNLQGTDPEFLREALMASYKYGPNSRENPLREDSRWQKIEEWRQKEIAAIISAAKNRVENRVGETPFYFPHDKDSNQEEMTPYRYMKAFHTFQELLFIWISESPSILDGLRYDEQNLGRTRGNEESVLLRGMDARVRWLPGNTEMDLRSSLKIVLAQLRDLAIALDRLDDLEPIMKIANGSSMTPSERLRSEVGAKYDMNTDRSMSRSLPDNAYQTELLERTRAGMKLELDEIEMDLATLPSGDQTFISYLLNMAKELKQ